MAKIKKEISEDLKELRSKLLENNVILGTDKTLKALQAKGVEKVYLSKNCPKTTVEDIQHYASLADVQVISLEMDNEELGVFCKKNFFISVLAITA
ncbi:50S ribosomal protein L30 [Candidatus Woesearchaeota archaeon]|jgi:ribosomal protein L30E|nr:50S ribosomal protein L30 [Candidatus Woesearchaeota archaeon]MBT4150391.1 50S ribosomal protein L30 [Candidatus Woesearchaeota archaeon]MBT4247391.1 50S ribosomal protein L30 [Candidatus Woesearchaeota archaeon]MBT4434554.1 50S ribosomal protein L30 [Candidatus Woesearchaeota archaeon]MBT7331995.1 50S ribosomal protein L30 [Candidatus Woesearchaeota archaeon]